MNGNSRRCFLKTVAAAAAVTTIPTEIVFGGQTQGTKGTRPFELGIASYSLRMFKLDELIEISKRLGIKRLTLKDMHLPLKSSDEEIAASVAKIKAAGLDAESCGVVYMRTEEEVRQTFAYAKKAGMKMIVGGPDPGMLPACDRMVKETDILLAIHNHGPTDKNFPSPSNVYEAIAKFDKRIGLCIDIAHTQRIGLDPTEEFVKCFDRTLDIHIKDCTSSTPSGAPIEIGHGVIDIPKFLNKVAALKYAHTLHFEFEKDPKDPVPGLAESIGYVRGVLATI